MNNTEIPEVDIPAPSISPAKKLFGNPFPIIHQHSQMDCSAACIAMVCKYYGKRLSLNFLREKLHIGQNGASLSNVTKVVKSLGFNAVTFKSTYDQLMTINYPIITNWDGYHWIVVYKVEKEKITVSDPEKGRKVYTRQEFEEGWTKYTLFLTPNDSFSELEEYKPSFKRYIPYIKQMKGQIIPIVLGSATQKFFGIFIPLLTMFIIDKVLMEQDQNYYAIALIAMIAFIFMQMITGYFQQHISLYMSQKLNLLVTRDFYRYLLHLPMRYFEDRSIGDITTRFDENDTITELLSSTVFTVFLDLISALIVSVIFFFISPVLLLIVLAISVIDLIQVLIVTPIMQRNYSVIFEKSAKQQSQLIESLTGMRTIKLLGLSNQERWKFEEKFIDLQNAELKDEKLQLKVQIFSDFLESTVSVILLFVGAWFVFNDTMTIGELIAFLALVPFVRGPLSGVISSWDELQHAINSLERVNDIYDTKREYSDDQRGDLIEPPLLLGNITFNKVSFRYNDNDDNILKNLNMTIKAGQKVGLVGRSGSGKSTTLKLLYGFYKPNSGELDIDGFDLDDIWIPSLRKQIGIVLQDSFLFEGTVRENISIGKQNSSFSDIVEAVKLANAESFILGLPNGYDTVIQGSGNNLSGGQKQRLALARVFLQKPNILILDEATSALDNESERIVMKNIYTVFENKTVIMIAHRLSTIKKADRIFVFDNGLVIEEGTHNELINEGGIYNMLYSRQSIKES